jgi:transcription elongation GreA/GreB family factor
MGYAAAKEEGMVRVGAIVQVEDGEVAEWWRIVPSHEADAMRHWISEKTPMARALLGHHIGDRVLVEGPGGRRWPVTILAIEGLA